jgi:cyclic-di-GMP-binding protein
MAKDASFDIISEVDMAEMDNALNLVGKEIANRFDFKGSISKVTRNNNELSIVADDDMKLNSVHDILENKLIKRSIQIGFLDYQEPEHALGGNVKQTVLIKQGLDKDSAKKITKFIKNNKFKANAQIQDDKIRVSSAKRDTLQEIIKALKEEDFGVVLEFDNYR